MTSRRAALAAVLLAVIAAGCLRPHPTSHTRLRVGTSGDYPPFSLSTPTQTTGFDIEVADRFAADTGRTVELVPFRWPDLRRDLAADRFDVAMGGITMRPERTIGATYTRPVVTTGAMVVSRNHNLTEISDVDRSGTRVAVNAGGHLEWTARRLFPHAMLATIPGNVRLPAVLDQGDADAIVIDDVEVGIVRAAMPEVVTIGPLTLDHKAYLARDPALAAELDAWIRARAADGWLDKARARWFGDGFAARQSGVGGDLDALVALIDLRLAFMPSVAAAKAQAHLPVEDAAQERRVLAAARASAERQGLDPASAEALFGAQIAAGRAVQRAFLALPPDRRPPVVPLDLDRDARPAIANLTDQIVARAAALASDRTGLAGVAPNDVAEALDPTLTPAFERGEIGEAVIALRPSR